MAPSDRFHSNAASGSFKWMTTVAASGASTRSMWALSLIHIYCGICWRVSTRGSECWSTIGCASSRLLPRVLPRKESCASINRRSICGGTRSGLTTFRFGVTGNIPGPERPCRVASNPSFHIVAVIPRVVNSPDAVSYTHLDVYKRQQLEGGSA